MKDILISMLLGLLLAFGLGFASEWFLFPGMAVATPIFGHDNLVGLAILGNLVNWLFYTLACLTILRWRRRAWRATVKNSN